MTTTKERTSRKGVTFRLNCGINSKIVTFLFASANEKHEDLTRVKLRRIKDAKQEAYVEGLENPASMIKKAQKSGKRCLAEMSFAYLTFVDTFVSKLTALVAAKLTPPLALQARKSIVTPPQKAAQKRFKPSAASNKKMKEMKRKELL